jgi:hypothetical protein
VASGFAKVCLRVEGKVPPNFGLVFFYYFQAGSFHNINMKNGSAEL